ncbi:hypothetical protein R1sor_023020 [Riccia sorocarpa]|uniref:Protein transport protein Sec24-like n=1 Tax=Riccia sorocarpa TaxID=122646 RepID=A0ABD3GQP0_9MARC
MQPPPPKPGVPGAQPGYSPFGQPPTSQNQPLLPPGSQRPVQPWQQSPSGVAQPFRPGGNFPSAPGPPVGGPPTAGPGSTIPGSGPPPLGARPAGPPGAFIPGQNSPAHAPGPPPPPFTRQPPGPPPPSAFRPSGPPPPTMSTLLGGNQGPPQGPGLAPPPVGAQPPPMGTTFSQPFPTGRIPGYPTQVPPGPPPTSGPYMNPPTSLGQPPFAGQSMQPPPFGPSSQTRLNQFPAPPQLATTQQGPPQSAPPFGPPPSYYGAPSPTSTPLQTPPPPMAGYGYDPTTRGLPEEFQSLNMVPLPGSMEAAVDASVLPRPTDDVEPTPSAWAANCHPRYLRLTSNSMPNAQSLVARWHLPLGAVVHPLAEAPPGEEVPVVNFGATSIVRCRRCRTYINAYVTFTDGGRRWRCNVCVLLNEVPVEYFCPLDVNGKRKDADERPELSQGSVEFVAPTEYMVRPPMPPVYFFLIDVSASAIRTGMLQTACETIKASLDKLPGYPRTQIGFITFDSALHFYNLKSTLTQPQMMVVAELDDPFLPMPDDLLVNLSESRAVVEALLDSLPAMFQNNLNVESALGPALKAAFMVMSQLGGKLLVFQSTLPSLGVGRLKLRGDDPRIYGTDKECNLRVTEEQFYKQMAADFSKYQIAVNVYAFAEKYTDLASLGTLPKYTGGQVLHYPGFQVQTHGEKFTYELGRDLTRETAWEAVMRIRCGKGIRFSTYHGHFMLRSSDLLALPAVDCDKAFAMQLTLEDTLLTSQTVYFQVAVLYTSSSGERRIRVHTMAAPVTAEIGEMYRSADVGAITSLMSRLAIEKSFTSKLEDSRQAGQSRLVRALREYKNLFAVQYRTTGRLIYPESLKLLPLYVLAINKSLALRGGFNEVSADGRSAAAFEMMTMPASRLLKYIYPSLYRIDDYLYQTAKAKADPVDLPAPLPLSAERLDPRGAYLYNDGLRFVLWVGKVVSPDFVGLLFGSEVAQSPDSSKAVVVEQDNDLSKRFIAVLNKLREKNTAVYQECLLVRQGEQPRESILLLQNLVEDRTIQPYGYVDWMTQIYRLVQQTS